MAASMWHSAGVLLVLAGSLHASTPVEALRCVHASPRGNPDVAIRHCTAAIKAGGLPDVGLAAVLSKRCRAYGVKKDYARALEDCERAVQLDPKSALVICRRGWVQLDAGHVESAVADFERATFLDPNMALAYEGRGYVHSRRAAGGNCAAACVRQYDQAIEDYTEALRIMPDRETYYARGWCHLKNRSYGLAKRDFDEAIRRGEDAGAYYYRARCYIHTVEYDLARADLDQAIRLDPNESAAYSLRAWIHSRRGEYAQAARDLTEALRIAPNAEGYRLRGVAYWHQGAFSLALQDYVRASWRFGAPILLLAGLALALWKCRRKKPQLEPPQSSAEQPDDVPPPAEEALPEDNVEETEPPTPADPDVLIRTGLRDPIAIGFVQGALRDAGIPFFVMDQNVAARQESGNIAGWWNVRVPRDRAAEAREIIQAVQEMK